MAFDKIKKFSKDTFNTRITTRADIAIITNDVKMTILFFYYLSIGASIVGARKFH